MTISVILPHFNHGQFLPVCLNGILSQTRLPSEIILIDDASTDNSRKIIDHYAKLSPIIKVLQNSKNKGPIYSVNRGIKYSSGEFLAFCAADDYIYPTFFESLASILELYPDAGMCTSDFFTFEKESSLAKEENFSKNLNVAKFYPPKKFAQTTFYTDFWIPTSCTLYRSSLVKKFKGLKNELKWASDWFLNYQIGFSSGVAYLPARLSAFRKVNNSYASVLRNNKRNQRKVLQAVLQQVLLEPKTFQNYFYESAAISNQGRAVLPCLIKHYKYFPFLISYLKKQIHKRVFQSKKACSK